MSLFDRLRANAQPPVAPARHLVQSAGPVPAPAPAAAPAAAPAPPPAPVLNKLVQPGIPLPGAADHEMRRILSLPVRAPLTPEEVEAYSRAHVQARYFDDGFRLFPAQVDLVREYERQGAFGQVKVGGGKTLAALMVAQKAHEKGLRKILLLTEAALFEQLTQRDIGWARSRVNLTVPIIDLTGRTLPDRQNVAAQGRRGLYLMSYSMLSSRDGFELLDMIKPELVIADEAHNLKNRKAARTGRFLDYMRKHQPQYLPMSGTISGKQVSDYHHQITTALRSNSPLPVSVIVAGDWGQVIDSDAVPSDSQAGALTPLIQWARLHFPNDDLPPTVSGFRQAFRRRLTSAPGVVVDDDDIGTSLTYVNMDATPAGWENYPGAKEQAKLIEQVDTECVTPNGDEIEHAMLKWKWFEELSAGFYNLLVWPTPQEWAKRKSLELDAATEALRRAYEHHATRQVYHSALRKWISEDGRPGLDTPLLVSKEMALNGAQRVSAKLLAAWKQMHDADFEGRPEREPAAVRVCDYKIKAAVAWADNLHPKEGAVIWYYHQEIGRWLVEMLEQGQRAADVMWCPAEGTRHGINLDMLDSPENRNRILVASIPAHSGGKNLQYLSNLLFVQFPRVAKTAEQAVGRLHRPGQEADHLDVVTMRSNWHDEINFAACINDALYVHQSTGARQKLIYATHVPLPKVYLPEFLAAQGLQPDPLNAKMREELKDRFGTLNTGDR